VILCEAGPTPRSTCSDWLLPAKNCVTGPCEKKHGSAAPSRRARMSASKANCAAASTRARVQRSAPTTSSRAQSKPPRRPSAREICLQPGAPLDRGATGPQARRVIGSQLPRLTTTASGFLKQPDKQKPSTCRPSPFSDQGLRIRDHSANCQQLIRGDLSPTIKEAFGP
jgi:hypothetical protein